MVKNICAVDPVYLLISRKWILLLLFVGSIFNLSAAYMNISSVYGQALLGFAVLFPVLGGFGFLIKNAPVQLGLLAGLCTIISPFVTGAFAGQLWQMHPGAQFEFFPIILVLLLFVISIIESYSADLGNDVTPFFKKVNQRLYVVDHDVDLLELSNWRKEGGWLVKWWWFKALSVFMCLFTIMLAFARRPGVAYEPFSNKEPLALILMIVATFITRPIFVNVLIRWRLLRAFDKQMNS